MIPRASHCFGITTAPACALAFVLALPVGGAAAEGASRATPAADIPDSRPAAPFDADVAAESAPIVAGVRWTPWIVLITWVLVGAGVAAAARSAGRADDDGNDETPARIAATSRAFAEDGRTPAPNVPPGTGPGSQAESRARHVQMPEVGGLRATAEVRQHEAYASALSTPPSALRQMHTPAPAGHPQDERQVEEEMAVHDASQIHMSSAPAEPPPPAAAARDAAAAATVVIDRAALAERLDHNVALLTELVGVFMLQAPRLLAGIRAAIASGDVAELEFHAHSLRGTLASFGADRAAAIALRLEQQAHAGDPAQAAATTALLEQEVTGVQAALTRLASERAPFGTQPAAA
jgi:HPt (histidine-containing phosphotransfer) domain-containing protein